MKRRDVLAGGVLLAGAGFLADGSTPAAAAARLRPGSPGWPGAADWNRLNRAVGGRLSRPSLPDFTDPRVRALLRDPFYLGEEPGLTQSSGWLDAWRSAPSAYVVAAESAADVAAAIGFARVHNLRLVVKGGGHSYLGASCAPGSLLVWTRRMRAVAIHEAFTPQGSAIAPVPAVSAAAGCIWLDLYRAVTGGAGRYVQGGGCTTVGVPGLVQGGGFGSFSKAYGTVAGSLLEAEIVTADGRVRVISATRDPELFWALKGGGGGSFGIVTRVTLATHDLPATFGVVRLALTARSDEAYRRLLARFADFYATQLFNPHWGEQVQARPDNRLDINMVFQGLEGDEARAAWRPLIEFARNSADYSGTDTLFVGAMPARHFWDADFYRRWAPAAVRFDGRPGGAATDFWWSGDAAQVGAFWYGYESAWLPATLLEPRNRSRFADAWFGASRHWRTSLHFNKGLAGAPAEARAAARKTAINPDVVDAFALAIIGAGGPPAFRGLPSPDIAAADAARSGVRAAMAAMRAVAPAAGSYVNECDYFQKDWQKAFWGPNYPRLLGVKRRCDPDGLFTVHHGVGSEAWSPDGFTRR